HNGMRDAGEEGVEGAKVLAIDIEGDKVSYATTDKDGRYMIDYLGKNTYYLQFDIPPGFKMTSANRGIDDTLDSDADGSNGMNTTKWYNILPGEHLENVDAGIVAGALPVVWSDVWAENRGSWNYVEWTTQSEWNLSHYEIERSVENTVDFISMARVEGGENTFISQTHHFDDYALETAGIYYYRIKQVDYNGDYEYSKIVSVQVKEQQNADKALSLYPNPVVSQLTASLYNPSTDGQIDYKIYDASGRLVLEKEKVAWRLVSNSLKFDIKVDQLEAGVYSIHVLKNDNRYIQKLIVIK
ncbi:MAG: T9SS type A sorting domain-containing protein, partial [Bacteroidia bacterium]|nr:T9SS type A sorting domain-containing protein [Bacteroidia bacterium]